MGRINERTHIDIHTNTNKKFHCSQVYNNSLETFPYEKKERRGEKKRNEWEIIVAILWMVNSHICDEKENNHLCLIHTVCVKMFWEISFNILPAAQYRKLQLKTSNNLHIDWLETFFCIIFQRMPSLLMNWCD